MAPAVQERGDFLGPTRDTPSSVLSHFSSPDFSEGPSPAGPLLLTARGKAEGFLLIPRELAVSFIFFPHRKMCLLILEREKLGGGGGERE